MQLSSLQTRIPSVLEDPSIASIARVYALALLDAAGSMSAEELLNEYQSFLDNVLTNHPQAEQILVSAVFSPEDKQAFIDQTVGASMSAVFRNFISVLGEHGRLSILRPIYDAARLLHEKRSGKRRVIVTLAETPSDQTGQKIFDQLVSTFGIQPDIVYQIEPSIIGGMIVRIGDTVYDSSLRSRLGQIKEQVRQRYLYEIQRGRDRFCTPEGN